MTYEYLCTACQHVWEAEQSISEAPLKTCPNCHEDRAKRQVSGGAGFILKGGGWYADLYGSPKPASDTKSDTKSDSVGASDSAPKESKKTESSGDAKPSKDGAKSGGESTKPAGSSTSKSADSTA